MTSDPRRGCGLTLLCLTILLCSLGGAFPGPAIAGTMPPPVDPIPNQVNSEGQAISLQILARDTNVTYSVVGLPAGLTISSSTGLISGTIAYTAAETQGGNYTVKVTVSNKAGATSVSFAWRVLDTPVMAPRARLPLLTRLTNSGPNPQLSASPATIRPGDPVTITGRGFVPGERIERWLIYPDGARGDYTEPAFEPVFADSSGSFSRELGGRGFVFPEAGRYEFHVLGSQSRREIAASFTVTP